MARRSLRNPSTGSTRRFLTLYRRRYLVPITQESLVPPGRPESWLLFWPGPLLTTIVRFESFLTDELGAGRVSMTIFSGVAASLRFWTLTFRPAFSAIRMASTSVFPTTGGTRVSPMRKIRYTVTMALSPRRTPAQPPSLAAAKSSQESGWPRAFLPLWNSSTQFIIGFPGASTGAAAGKSLPRFTAIPTCSIRLPTWPFMSPGKSRSNGSTVTGCCVRTGCCV